MVSEALVVVKQVFGTNPATAAEERSSAFATFDLYGRVIPRSNVVQVTGAAP